MKNCENDTSYLRYLNEIFRHCERMFPKAKFWFSQQKVKFMKKTMAIFVKELVSDNEKCSNWTLVEKIEVYERADIIDLWSIESGGLNIQVSMFKKAFECTTLFCFKLSIFAWELDKVVFWAKYAKW